MPSLVGMNLALVGNEPVKVQPDDLLHPDDVRVEGETPANVADHDGHVIHRRPVLRDSAI